MNKIALKIENVSKSFGEVKAVNNISLDILEGEFVSFLGPSGCGKTTTLRMIGGFEQPDSGRLFLFDDDITYMPPHARGIGMVFQDYALWPHMTVMQHMAFGLKIKGYDAKEIARRTSRALELVRLEGMENRYPGQLSGGQRQRVALARAIVMEPKVLLLDEPLSNLDRKLRDTMKVELRRLQRLLGITMVFVTHDQEEALALSDKVVVMDAGDIVQTGSSRSIYENPADLFVAGFVGDANFIDGVIKRIEAGMAAVQISPEHGIRVPLIEGESYQPGESVTLFARPEGVQLVQAEGSAPNLIPVELMGAIYEGADSKVAVKIAGTDTQIMVKVDSQTMHLPENGKLFLAFSFTRIYKKGGVAI